MMVEKRYSREFFSKEMGRISGPAGLWGPKALIFSIPSPIIWEDTLNVLYGYFLAGHAAPFPVLLSTENKDPVGQNGHHSIIQIHLGISKPAFNVPGNFEHHLSHVASIETMTRRGHGRDFLQCGENLIKPGFDLIPDFTEGFHQFFIGLPLPAGVLEAVVNDLLTRKEGAVFSGTVTDGNHHIKFIILKGFYRLGCMMTDVDPDILEAGYGPGFDLCLFRTGRMGLPLISMEVITQTLRKLTSGRVMGA